MDLKTVLRNMLEEYQLILTATQIEICGHIGNNRSVYVTDDHNSACSARISPCLAARCHQCTRRRFARLATMIMKIESSSRSWTLLCSSPRRWSALRLRRRAHPRGRRQGHHQWGRHARGDRQRQDAHADLRFAIIAAKLSVVPVRRGYWGNRIRTPCPARFVDDPPIDRSGHRQMRRRPGAIDPRASRQRNRLGAVPKKQALRREAERRQAALLVGRRRPTSKFRQREGCFIEQQREGTRWKACSPWKHRVRSVRSYLTIWGR